VGAAWVAPDDIISSEEGRSVVCENGQKHWYYRHKL